MWGKETVPGVAPEPESPRIQRPHRPRLWREEWVPSPQRISAGAFGGARAAPEAAVGVRPTRPGACGALACRSLLPPAQVGPPPSQRAIDSEYLVQTRRPSSPSSSFSSFVSLVALHPSLSHRLALELHHFSRVTRRQRSLAAQHPPSTCFPLRLSLLHNGSKCHRRGWRP